MAQRLQVGVALAKINRRLGGFTLIEGIIATFILVVVVAAMFASWIACYKQSEKIQEVTEGANIAQSELEIARVFGADNIPTGTYSSGTQTGTWSGAYIPATGWTAGGTAYFDYTGAQLTSSTSAFFSLTVAITDSTVTAGSGSSYQIGPKSIRALVVTVKNVGTGAADFTMATNLVEGGV